MLKNFTLKELLPQVNKINFNIKKDSQKYSSKKFPKHSITGEEEASFVVKGSDHEWIIDPIDGTKAFNGDVVVASNNKLNIEFIKILKKSKII